MSSGKVAFAVIALTMLSACGSDGQDGARPSASRPSATTTARPTPTAPAETTATPAPDAAATPTSAPPEPDEGDEAGNRVRVELTLQAERIRPRRVDVPAFLGLRLVVRNASGSERILQVDGRTVLELLPGATETADVGGLQPGEHALTTSSGGRATIVAERP